MKVWRLCWLGPLALPNGDRVQVFGPGDRYDAFLEEHARRPVALFEVDDVHGARRELEAAGIELIGAVEVDDKLEWINFCGPDGNLYELKSRRATG